MWQWLLYATCIYGSPPGCVSIPESPLFPVEILALGAISGMAGVMLLAFAYRTHRKTGTKVALWVGFVLGLSNLALASAVLLEYLDVYRGVYTALDRGGSIALLTLAIIVAGLLGSFVIAAPSPRGLHPTG